MVLGAGMAGLLAARVLSDSYDSVSLVERDWMPGRPGDRKGVPQGRHVHNFLSRGLHVLAELFPGLIKELAAAGAVVVDDGDLSHVYARIGRYEMKRSGKMADPSLLTMCLASRPFIEFHVRRRVRALPNVTLLDGHDALEPVATADVVTGVRVVKRNTGFESRLDADLVVDAMGRASRTPAVLESLGYGSPTEHRAAAKLSYCSQRLKIPKGHIHEQLAMLSPGGGRGRGLLVAGEHDTWMLAVGQSGEIGHPPTDFAAMLAMIEPLLPASIVAGLRTAQPLGETVTYHHTAAVWRRYDRMPRFPSGLLVVGDALCYLDPTYGQGMTMAALEALTLRDCLESDDGQLAQRFFSAAAQDIGSAWSGNKARDRADSPTRGRRSARQRLQAWLVMATMNAAAHDIALTERLYRITNLIDPPSRLKDPGVLPRIAAVNAQVLFEQFRNRARTAFVGGKWQALADAGQRG
ncbi:FAD-dependent monooxygenase [Mycobacterium sp. 94-17]|nr:FAD-dependent oxidoreductase [Mycobacterium sp. 94-17]MEB4210696.1 FAD-dependent monooxygenase [Mycobacterium sp. 94-17]